MVTVGIRELKSKLSEYIRLVRAGETVRVTDRGEVVAEMRPPEAPRGPTPFPGLNAMILEGAAHAPLPSPPADLYAIGTRPRIAPGAPLDWLDRARGE